MPLFFPPSPGRMRQRCSSRNQGRTSQARRIIHRFEIMEFIPWWRESYAYLQEAVGRLGSWLLWSVSSTISFPRLSLRRGAAAPTVHTNRLALYWRYDNMFNRYLIHFPIALEYVDPSVRYPPRWADPTTTTDYRKRQTSKEESIWLFWYILCYTAGPTPTTSSASPRHPSTLHGEQWNP